MGNFKYRILGGEEGHGGVKSGMGIVYVCYTHESNEVLALKTFQDKFLSSKGMKDNFKKEALAWIHLEGHPYIVRARWARDLDYRMFVGCEFIAPDEGGRNTLTHHLKGTISLKQALEWSIQFCHGMEHARSRGVTPHRDIKPDNIMITKDGIVKIADFGLAGLWAEAERAGALRGLMEEERQGLTFIKLAGGKVLAGTPPWVAPEQFEGEADVRSDIYSLGIVLYQMANGGGLPFYPRIGNGWKMAHQTYPVPILRSRLFSLTERCLQKKPEDRYRGFDELREELERLYGEVTGEKPPSPPGGIVLEAGERSNKGLSLANLGLMDEAIVGTGRPSGSTRGMQRPTSIWGLPSVPKGGWMRPSKHLGTLSNMLPPNMQGTSRR